MILFRSASSFAADLSFLATLETLEILLSRISRSEKISSKLIVSISRSGFGARVRLSGSTVLEGDPNESLLLRVLPVFRDQQEDPTNHREGEGSSMK